MSTIQDQNAINAGEKPVGAGNGINTHDHVNAAAAAKRKPYNYGGNPLAQVNTSDSVRLPAFGGEFQPGTYRAIADRKIANPAPLGLSAFALTTFILSLINLGTRGVTAPNIIIGAAFAYGGLVQLLAGMWEMAIGNTFGATALSSYGGFWIAVAIILTPGGFAIETNLVTNYGANSFLFSFGFFLMGWFIFTTLLLLCTLRSTVAFFFLFFTLDLAFLMLGVAYLYPVAGAPQPGCLKAGGVFGLLAAFAAWYNAVAGLLEPSNSFFLVPVAHFPWSDKGRERRGKVDNTEARMDATV
ncbi:hypothetical protein AMS68_003018 [Peltaster fructicola]|uniref:Acetate permease A n=1 Tax=Peltaster fructicola TaxID=286661 RepID=A0A6H0XS68_9PEZI|nr:hypothetical protein AMS68_003018 [Peltaster fructicola]